MAVPAEMALSSAALLSLSQKNALKSAVSTATKKTKSTVRQPVFSPRDQFDRYMTEVKRTPIMSHQTLTEVARASYKARYEMLKILSEFPPCAEAVVEQFGHYSAMGFKYNGFLDSYGDQSVTAKDALAALNGELGQGKVEDTLAEEEALRRGLELLKGYWQAFRDADPRHRQSTGSLIRKRLSNSFLYCGFHHEEFARLCKIFEDNTFEVQRFADLFMSLATERRHMHILDRFTEEDLHAITANVPEENRRRFFIEASQLKHRLDSIGLSMRECLALRADYDDHKAERDRLNNSIVEANLLFAARQAINQRPHDDRLFDACQEANEGLIKAVNRFAYWKGYAFTTYACRWIDNFLQRNRQSTANSDFPVPISIVIRGTKINRVREQHGESRGARPLTASQVAEKVGCSRAQVDEVSVAFNALTNCEEVAMGIPCEHTSAHGMAETAELQSVVNNALLELTEQQRQVCILRWGIGGKDPMTLREISKTLGLSTERVRMIEGECLLELAQSPLIGKMYDLRPDA